MDILKLIMESNAINFLILLILLGIVFKKIDLKGKFEQAQENVNQTIEKSDKAKKEAIEKLANTKNIVSNVANEVREIEDNAQENCEKINGKILQEAQEQIKLIKNNIDKVAHFEKEKITSNLSKQTALASVETAKKHLISLLEKNPNHHQDFIEKSMQEFDRLEK